MGLPASISFSTSLPAYKIIGIVRIPPYICHPQNEKPPCLPLHTRLFNPTLKSLTPPDTHHLSAAQGWLELGNPLEATTELEQITPLFRTHPDVLDLSWQINAKSGNWDSCVEIGHALVKTAPDQPENWIHRSYALHELKRTREAFDWLEPAAALFPKVWLIPYNLACYSCQLGNRDDALKWLTATFKRGGKKAVKLMALQDPDLQPLSAEIKEL
ncbi:MAG: hypothetical protein JWR19_2830 [Pedosphaera sp.]|nr:hypothetical protein [Pedosphaera sp.]